MLTILIILLTGIALGRIWLTVTGRPASYAGNTLGYVVWVMLAVLGLRIGADHDIMERLPTLGLQALMLGGGATIVSGVTVSLASRRFHPREAGLTDERHYKFSGAALKGSAVTMLFFAAGLTAGYLEMLPVDATTAEHWANRLLQILIGLVGMSTGANPELTAILRGLRPIAITVPVISVLASLAAGTAIGAVCTTGAIDGALAVSGMSYYSLSSMIISDLRSADMGAAPAMSLAAIALLANMVREILALIAIPAIGRRLGLYGSVAMCGVTSIDVTLATLVSTFGAEAIPLGLINGLLLEISTPFTVMAACTAAAALS